MSETLTGNPFPETADIETSTDGYANRFGGKTGAWMLTVQEHITLDLLKDLPGTHVLDVGGGHGQLAVPLCREGFTVTVLASAESCRKRVSEVIDAGTCTFTVGNVIALPFPDNHFKAAICFRLLTHCEAWPTLVKELCRVSAGPVIVDYPTSQSLNRIAPMLFKAKKKFEKDTRTWRLFRHKEVLDAFAANGYRQQRRRGQFFLPMVLHRAIKSPTLSAPMEALCRMTGLTRLWGSPVIARMIPD